MDPIPIDIKQNPIHPNGSIFDPLVQPNRLLCRRLLLNLNKHQLAMPAGSYFFFTTLYTQLFFPGAVAVGLC